MDINIDSIEYSIEQTVEICKSYSPGGVVLDNPQSSEGEAGRKSSPEILLQRDCSFDRNEIIVRSKKSSRSSCLSSEDRDSDVDIMSDSGGEPDVNFEENQFLTASEGETGGEDERSDGDCASRRSSIDDGCNVESLRRDAIEGSDGEESCSREANETASDDENEVTAMQIVDGDCQMKSQEDSEMNDEEEDGEMKADEDSKVNDEEENGEMKANEDSEMNDEQDKEDSEVKADEDSEINDEEEDCEMRDGGEDETHSMDCVEQASASSGLQGLQDEAEHSDQCSSTGELEIDDGGMSKESKHLASDGEGKSSGRDDSSQPDDSSHPDELLLSDESLKPERVTTPASPQKDNDSDCASSQHAPLEDFAHGSPTSSQSNHLPCGPTSPRDRSGERGSRLSPPRKSTNPLDPPITIETGVFAPTASSTSSSSSEHGDPLSPALDKELMKAGDANRRKQSEDRGRRVEAIRLVTQNGQKRIVAKSEATNATKQDFNDKENTNKEPKLAPLKIVLDHTDGKIQKGIVKYKHKADAIKAAVKLAESVVPPSVNMESRFYKPFSYKWRREIVIRKIYDTNKQQRPSDVYYYTPTGEKLRSMREITAYCSKNNVGEISRENFTFLKHPIHCPPKEIVRTAMPRLNGQVSHGRMSPKISAAGNKTPTSAAQSPKRGRKSGSQNSNTTTPSSPALSDSPKTTTSAPANGSRRIRKPTQKYSCGANPKDVDDIIEGRKEPKLVQNIIPNLMKTPVVVSKNGVQLLVTPPLGMLGKRAASSSPPCSAAPPAKVTSTSSLSPGAIDLQILPMSQYATMRKKSDHGNFIKPFVVKKEPSRGYSDEVKKPKIINKSQVDSKTSNMHDNSTAEVLGTVISLPSKSPLKPTILRSLVNSVGESTRVLVSTSPPSRFVNTNTNTNTNSNSINTANNITSATRVVLPKPREQSLCGMSCPGLKSVIPSLHCQICMCMFHPKCVGVETNTTNFICLNCQSTNNISGITNPANKSYKNGITKEQMLSGRIITLPETMSRRIDMNTSLQVKIEGITYNVPPNCFINSPDGSFKVLLPNSTKPHQAKMLNNRTRYINGRIQTPIISSSSSSSANTTSTTTTTTTIVQQTSLISAPTALNGGNRLAGSLTVNGTVGTGAGGAGAGGAGAIQIIANGQCSSIARSSAPILNNSMVVGGGVGGGVGGVGGVVGGANVSPRCSVVNSAQTAHTTTTNNTPNNQFSGSLQPLARAGPLILGPGSIRIVGNGNQANIGNQGNGNNNNGAAGLTISGGGMVNIATHNRPIARAHLVDNSPRIAASVRCPTQLNPTGGGHVVGGARVLPAHGHILAPGAQIIGGPRLVAGSLNGHCISSTPTLTLGTAGPVVVHQHNGVGSNAVTTSTPINILPPTANKASTASPVTARAPGVVVATPGLTIGPVIKNPVVTSGGPVIGTPVTNSASVASCNVVATAGLKIGPVIKNPTATARTSGAPTVVGTAGLTIGPVIKNPGVCSAPTGIVGTPISASPAPPVATPGLTIGPVIKNPVARPGEIIRMATVIGPPVSASSILSATPIAPPPANKPKAVVAMPLVEMTKQQLHNAVIPKKKSLTINSLDHDILRNVFSYLPVQNLSRVQCVCKKWSSIASHQKLWKKVDLRCHLLRNFDFISNYLFNRGTVTSLDIRGCGYDKAKLLDFISDFTRLQSLALNSVDSNMLEHLGKLRFFKVLYIELDNSTIVKGNIKFKIVNRSLQDGI